MILGGGNWPDAVEQLSPRDERHAQARQPEQNAAITGIGLHVVDAALDRADGNGISHKICLKTRLDYEQSADLSEHCHKLSKRR
jgi:hypothetical protein